MASPGELQYTTLQLIKGVQYTTLQLIKGVHYTTLQLVEDLQYTTLQLVEDLQYIVMYNRTHNTMYTINQHNKHFELRPIPAGACPSAGAARCCLSLTMIPFRWRRIKL